VSNFIKEHFTYKRYALKKRLGYEKELKGFEKHG
jgi:hypothetical protein